MSSPLGLAISVLSVVFLASVMVAADNEGNKTGSLIRAPWDQLQNIYDLADRLGQYTFVQAAKETGLVYILRNSNDITVFIPTNQAFNKLPDSAIDYWGAHPKDYENQMRYHIVQGRYLPHELVDEQTLTTMNNNLLARFNIYNHTRIANISTFQGAVVSSSNYSASNGIIYFIDEVVEHIATESTIALVNATSELSKLRQVVAVCGSVVTDALTRLNTLFAPNDEAWNKLPAGAFDLILRNRSRAENVMLHHITQLGTYFTTGLIDGENIPMLAGSVTVRILKGVVAGINDANLVSRNNATTTGVIHVVDTVLFDQRELAVELEGPARILSPASPIN